MSLSEKALEIHNKVDRDNTKMGDLRKIAKEIKKDHELAMELWSTEAFMSRQLAVLIMDKKMLSDEVVDNLCQDIQIHNYKDRTYIADWLLANQFTKDKKLIAQMEGWMNSPSPVQRRLFWYYQGRLRWMGKTPPSNTEFLLEIMKKNMIEEEPEVQWAMNFTAGWIGVFDEKYRDELISLGEENGLYKDEKAPKGCTPNYLPEFIRIEVEKRANK